MRSMDRRAIAFGAAAAMGGRALLPRLVLMQLRRDVRAINAGDHRPLLSCYADHAILRVGDGEHRWAGEHRGKAAIERFLVDFTRAGLQGELSELFIGGPLWRLTLVVRFDDRAEGPDGERLYENRAVLLVRTRWGRIVQHEDFFEDTVRLDAFERALNELGIAPGAR